ncbi:glycosyltransferase family 61 protein [Lutimaribacter marinistellae]|uniref:Glycosyltransferase family 61 protein n=1 Tax=Lutimaribacter marinistellae TaxID=1820329 RepID=A0ABV7TCU9_9RHOB
MANEDAAPDLNNPETQPMPEGGWSESCEEVSGAIVVPPKVSAFTQAAGILYPDGRHCARGALWRKFRPLTILPEMPETEPDVLKGRWLWGGVLWAHFGHFLVESTSRLWALDRIEGDIDGVLFIPKRPRVGDAVRGFQRDYLDLMQAGLPIEVATNPVRVEQLIVPGQGFGLGAITRGTPAFRSAIRNRFGRGIEPDGASRLYISRSALGLGKGGLLGEERLEDHLRAEGYEIFHPEKYTLATQIARYKAARQVVAADGSALHLFAMVGRAEQQVAMILRRSSGANNLLATNVAAFCGSDPLIIDALNTEWWRRDHGKSNRLSFGELHHPAIAEALSGTGFIREGADWPIISDEERERLFKAKGLDLENSFMESPEHERQRKRRMREERRARRAERETMQED